MAYSLTRFTFRQDDVASIEFGSGGAPAGVDPGSIGWSRPTGSIITCTDSGAQYIHDGTGTWDQQLDANSTFQDAADLQDMVTEAVLAPTADAVAAIHAGFPGNNASNDFPGAFTNPDVPRNLSFTFGAAWDGGNVTPVGTDIDDAPCTEVITAPGGGGVVQSLKIYKTVTSATKGAIGIDAATCSIDSWHMLGLVNPPAVDGGILSVAGLTEAATWSAAPQAKGFTPTTLPDGAKDFVAEFPRAGATSVVTATP